MHHHLYTAPPLTAQPPQPHNHVATTSKATTNTKPPSYIPKPAPCPDARALPAFVRSLNDGVSAFVGYVYLGHTGQVRRCLSFRFVGGHPKTKHAQTPLFRIIHPSTPPNTHEFKQQFLHFVNEAFGKQHLGSDAIDACFRLQRPGLVPVIWAGCEYEYIVCMCVYGVMTRQHIH